MIFNWDQLNDGSVYHKAYPAQLSHCAANVSATSQSPGRQIVYLDDCKTSLQTSDY